MFFLVYFLAETPAEVQNTAIETAPRIIDEFLKGGPVMWPLLGLSVLTLATALERGWFWIRLVSQEDRIVNDVLDAARYDMGKAAEIAEYVRYLAIGRFLLAPLKLRHPTPETFRLAMEAAADKEFVKMRKGDKLFETVVAVAPLLGLLGTVTGLIRTFDNLNVGAGGSAEEATKAAGGIGEALITTAAGMIVAIVALLVFRLMVTLQSQQMDYFAQVGSELELIYRQFWHDPNQNTRSMALPASKPSNHPSSFSVDD
ncbi:MAG: MotA/TolQ/ExbB proton channel family protein [Cyanobacteria bacterium SBC]|nr:MotA/TolQ/ExbB proton channel family protein [Cyanobacteria bacterium SBC]